MRRHRRLGTITVTHMGATYYVCCSGCRDAFNENPAKILAEYTKRKRAPSDLTPRLVPTLRVGNASWDALRLVASTAQP